MYFSKTLFRNCFNFGYPPIGGVTKLIVVKRLEPT